MMTIGTGIVTTPLPSIAVIAALVSAGMLVTLATFGKPVKPSSVR